MWVRQNRYITARRAFRVPEIEGEICGIELWLTLPQVYSLKLKDKEGIDGSGAFNQQVLVAFDVDKGVSFSCTEQTKGYETSDWTVLVWQSKEYLMMQPALVDKSVFGCVLEEHAQDLGDDAMLGSNGYAVVRAEEIKPDEQHGVIPAIVG